MKACPVCHQNYQSNFRNCPLDASVLMEVEEWEEGMVVRQKYRILGKVGQGGMATVYKALHVLFQEEYALKLISKKFADDPSFVKRFKQEAVVTRKLQHPNAVQVHEIEDAEDGRPFIVMEFVQGRNLKEVIKAEAPLAITRACSIAMQVAEALDAAHRLGMIHRDIKPENIVLANPQATGGQTGAAEQARVLDFGIAKIKEGYLENSGLEPATLTGTDLMVGTPAYMSPEQAKGRRGKDLDGRSDLYSLGIVMYQMLTGHLPFAAESTEGFFWAHIRERPQPVREWRPEIPDSVARIVMGCLEKNPDRRPDTALDLIRAIKETGEANARSTDVPHAFTAKPAHIQKPIQGERKWLRRLWLAGSAVAIFLILGGLYLLSTLRSTKNNDKTQPAPAQIAPSPIKSEATPQAGQPQTSTSSNEAIVAQRAQESAKVATVPLASSPIDRGKRNSTTKHVGSTPNPRAVPPFRQLPPERLEPAEVMIRVADAIKRGDGFYEKGQYDSAIREYQKGLVLDPSNAILKEQIARSQSAKATEERLGTQKP